MKYRIIKHDGRFLLQRKTLLGWVSVKYPGGQDYESNNIEYLEKHIEDLKEYEEERKDNGKVVKEI